MLKQNITIIILLLSFFFLSQSGFSQEESFVCGEASLNDAIDKGRKLTADLRSAQYWGKLEIMTNVAKQLEALIDRCKDSQKGTEKATEFSCINTDLKPEIDSDRASVIDFQIGAVCDFDCHYELSRYHLFMAGDYLKVTDRDTVVSDVNGEALKHAQDCGIPIATRGLKVVHRSQSTDLATNDSESDNEKLSPKDKYRLQTAMLLATKAKLLIAAGDINYQSTSINTLKGLADKVETEVNEISSKKKMTSALQLAYDKYEEADWTITEGRLLIPETIHFNGINFEFSRLDSDTAIRRQSVEKGYLFLDIDPDGFTTLPLDYIFEALKSLEGRMGIVEKAIKSLVEEGQRQLQNEGKEGVDETRAINNLKMALSTQKMLELKELGKKQKLDLEQGINEIREAQLKVKIDIDKDNLDEAKLRELIANMNESINEIQTNIARTNLKTDDVNINIAEARKSITKLNEEINEINHESAKINYQQEIRKLTFKLFQNMTTYEFDRKLIENKKEGDLLAHKRGIMQDLVRRYQWLISFKITTLNLDTQIQSIGGQILELSRKLHDNVDSVANLTGKIESNILQFDSSNDALIKLKDEAKIIIDSRFQSFLLQRKAYKNKICTQEALLKYIGYSKDYSKYGENDIGTYEYPALSPIADLTPYHSDPVTNLTGNDEVSYGLFSGVTVCDDYDDLLKESLPGEEGADKYSRFGLPKNIDNKNFPLLYEKLKDITVNTKNPIYEYVREYYQEKFAESTALLNEINKPCSLAFEIKDTETQRSYAENSCNLRKLVADSQKEYLTFMQNCVYAEIKNLDPNKLPVDSSGVSGSNCTNEVKPYAKFALDSYLKNLTIVEAEIGALKEKIAHGKSQLEKLEKYYERLDAFIASKHVILKTLKATGLAIIGADITISSADGVCGQGPCKYITTTPPKKGETAKYEFRALAATIDLLTQQAAAHSEFKKAYDQIKRSIQDLESSLDPLKLKKTIQQTALMETVNELRTSRVQVKNKLKQLELNSQLTQVSCDETGAKMKIDTEVAFLKHQELLDQLSSLDLASNESDMSLRAKVLSANTILRSQDQTRIEIETYLRQIIGLRRNSVNLAKQVDNSVNRMCMIGESRTYVSDIAQEEDEVQQQIAAINDLIEDNIVESHEIKLEQISEILHNEQEFTDEQKQSLNQQLYLLENAHEKRAEKLRINQDISVMNQKLAELEKLKSVEGLLSQQQKQKIAALETKIRKININSAELFVEKDELETGVQDLQSQITSLNQEVYDQINVYRNDIKDLINDSLEATVTADGKMTAKKFYADRAQRQIATLFRGVGEYVSYKKRLVTRTNTLLSLLRAKVNTLNVLGSDGKRRFEVPYIVNSTGISTLIEDVKKSLLEDEVKLSMGTPVTFQIDPGYGMAQELFNKGRVLFQVAPLGMHSGSEKIELMKEKGYYVLWAPEVQTPNARLIDVIMSASLGCDPHIANGVSLHIVHRGDGMIYSPISSTSKEYESRLIANNPRSFLSLPLRDETTMDNGFFEDFRVRFRGSKLRDFDNAWKGYTNFLGNAQKAQEFVGLPVAGVYELVLNNGSQCRWNGDKKLKLHFLFTRDLKIDEINL